MAFLDELVGLAGDYVRSGGVRIGIKTNFGPEFTVATSEITGGSSSSSGSRSGGGLLDLLGLRAAVIVRDRDGRRIATFGDVPATEPWRLVLLLAVAGALGAAILRGVLK